MRLGLKIVYTYCKVLEGHFSNVDIILGEEIELISRVIDINKPAMHVCCLLHPVHYEVAVGSFCVSDRDDVWCDKPTCSDSDHQVPLTDDVRLVISLCDCER